MTPATPPRDIPPALDYLDPDLASRLGFESPDDRLAE